MKKCRECGISISSLAEACPSCGAPLKKPRGCGTAIAVGFVILAIIGISSGFITPTNIAPRQAHSTTPSDPVIPKGITPKTPEEIALARAQRDSAKEAERIRLYGWNRIEGKDEMSGKPVINLTVTSLYPFNLQFPYHGEQRASLIIRKHPRYQTDAILAVERGQLHCEYQNCTINVRFDNGPVRAYAVTQPADHSSTAWFIDQKTTFIAQLKRSKRCFIELQFFTQGRLTTEFITEDMPELK